MPQSLCLVCGAHRDEVEKMHNFPKNLERSKIWQETMGMAFIPGVSLCNYLICSRHFTNESYLDIVRRKLRNDAIPTLFTSFPQEHHDNRDVVENVEIPESMIEKRDTGNMEGTPLIEEAIPSTSEMEETTPRAEITKPSVFRGISGVSRIDATPRKLRLIRMVESKESHVRKLKKMCKKRSHDIKALTDLSDSSVVKNIFKGMPNTTANFLISQLRCAKRTPKGRRWTVDEKVMALALLKKSPKCYNLLRRIVALPSKKTVLTLLQQVPFHSGINEHLFNHIRDCVSHKNDKQCVLLFDEMDIKEHVQYDQHHDRIIGFEEFGNDLKSSKWANRALVFMVQGLGRKWKQPVAYYFCNGACPSTILKNCIHDVVKACEEIAGLTIVSTICDMGSTNVKALKEMGVTIETPFFTSNNKKIFSMFDPPHLLKCTVSLFRKHNILIPVGVGNEVQLMEARFRHVIEAHDIDKRTPLVFRSMHKVKDIHLAPVMQYAMKVHIAAQVMSHTVAAYIYTLLSRGELEQRALATATFIRQVDELFDSFNGNKSTCEGKDLKCEVREDSRHMAYWSEAFKMVKNWKYQRYTKSANIKEGKPPSQIGWLITLTSVRKIWTHLHDVEGFESLRPRSLNQDALENLFGAIRGGCGESRNPTSGQFAASLKTQILNGLTQRAAIGTNCEEDDHDLLTNLHAFLTIEKEQRDLSYLSPSDPHHTIVNSVADAVSEAVRQGATETLSVAYVSGFIAKRLLEEIDCENCQKLLFSSSDLPHNLFISFKEWSEDKERLKYPSEALVITVGHSITILESTLDAHCCQARISHLISTKIQESVSFSSLSCLDHKKMVTDGILRAIIRIGIPWWCKRKNEERLKARKDARASKQKLRTFRHV